jgi:gliding motility-associated-like protein
MKRVFYSILVALGISSAYSQSVTVPLQVINSAGGGGAVGGGVEVYYNIGEPVITTVGNSNITITQGFLQPDFIGKLGLSANAFVNNVSCNSKQDGVIIITPTIAGVSNLSNYAFEYHWSPSTVCPDLSCSGIDSLSPGTYSVMVVSIYTGGSAIPNDTVMLDSIVIQDNTDPCLIEVFNGVTPNGDSKNDLFFVKNIDQYPDNVVYIFNRWGQKMDEIKNYDNIQNYWPDPTKRSGGSIPPSGTYFYIIQLDGNTKPIKGWLELTRQ